MSQQSIEHRAAIMQNMMTNDTECSSGSARVSILRVESVEQLGEFGTAGGSTPTSPNPI